jgi:transglutaminase-like putative cysteine protease
MNRKSYLLPAAVLSVLLTMMSLAQVFDRQRWFWPSVFAAGVAFGAGWVARRLDVPAVLSPAVSLLALVALLGIVFHSGTTTAGIPSAATMRAIGESLQQSWRDVRELAAPASPTNALTLLATSGVFLVAMLVDLIVFRIRRPAAAGLPLLALFLIPTAMTAHGNVFAFVLGAFGYLAVLVAEGRDRARGWGRRLSGVEHADDVADVSHVARVGRRIGTAAVGIALCVPVVVPSVGPGIFSGTGGGPFGRGKGSKTAIVINPIVEIKGQLQDKTRRELFVVKTNSPDYLRLTSLDVFDGSEWSLVKRRVDSDHKVGKKKHIPAPPQLKDLPTTEATYDITVGELAVRWLPVPYVPSVVDVDGDWRYEDYGLSIFSAERTTHGVHFTATSELPSPTTEQLEAPGPIPDSIQPYRDVPPNTPPEALDVLHEVTKGARTPYQRAKALNDYFFRTGGFQYSLEVPAGSSQDALTNFLVNKVGYCEQFAAAMAYLSRLAGIPARVVVGFTPGSLRNDGAYHVTNKDAHAWPELWFPHAGWVRFEPTPRPGTQQPAWGQSTPPVTDPSTPGSSESPKAPTPSATSSKDPFKGADEANGDPDNPNDPANLAARKRSGSLPLLPLGLGVALVALVTPSAVAFGTRRRRRMAAADHVGRIHAAWLTLADAAEDSGYPLRPADSPRAAARRLVSLASLTGEAADEVRRLAQAEERARYARSTPPVDGLDSGVRVVARAMRASLPRVARVRATVFPASALRRIVDAARATGETIDRTRTRSRLWARGLIRRRPRTA